MMCVCVYVCLCVCETKVTFVGRVLIGWFNDRIQGRSGQIANPIIAMVDPVLYYSIVYAHVYVCESINCECRKYSQLKTDLWYSFLTVECEAEVFSLLCSFLTGLDHLEDHCSPVMDAISLFIALKENSNSDQVKGKLKGKILYNPRYTSILHH